MLKHIGVDADLSWGPSAVCSSTQTVHAAFLHSKACAGLAHLLAVIAYTASVCSEGFSVLIIHNQNSNKYHVECCLCVNSTTVYLPVKWL